MNIPSSERLEKVYGESVKSAARFKALAEQFKGKYGHDEAEFFSAPGRTEIIGNHTDHNGGKVIAGSIDLDTVGAAYPNDSNVIHITSEGYNQEIVVDIDALDSIAKGGGTVALLAGMMEGAQKFGFQVGGFDAYVSTNVIAAAGVS
ncbi:MAG: galactokinase family protein, partial [Lachnospiraceae bacterium]|nr:galactokinase family protein [Lachnospiraceae bacterium]